MANMTSSLPASKIAAELTSAPIEEIGALITDSKRSLTKATSGGLR